MPERPWFKFYSQDWIGDPALDGCSMTAQGVWINLIARIHLDGERGTLLLNGRPPSDALMARKLRLTVGEYQTIIAELESAGVLSRRRNGAIYSRRMERDLARVAKLRENGRKGGNPRLKKDNEEINASKNGDKGEIMGEKAHALSADNETIKTPLDNQEVNTQVKPHIPYARGQTLELEVESGTTPCESQESPSPTQTFAHSQDERARAGDGNVVVLSVPAAKREEPPPKPNVDVEFEQRFWPQVWRKVGKGQARKAYRTARKSASCEDILAGVARFSAEIDRKGTEPQYTPHPKSWLNGERWNDEPDFTPATSRETAHGHRAGWQARSSRHEPPSRVAAVYEAIDQLTDEHGNWKFGVRGS